MPVAIKVFSIGFVLALTAWNLPDSYWPISCPVFALGLILVGCSPAIKD